MRAHEHRPAHDTGPLRCESCGRFMRRAVAPRPAPYRLPMVDRAVDAVTAVLAALSGSLSAATVTGVVLWALLRN